VISPRIVGGLGRGLAGGGFARSGFLGGRFRRGLGLAVIIVSGVIGRLGAGAHLSDRALDDLDPDALRQLQRRFIVGQARHLADQTAAADHFVTPAQIRDHLTMTFHLLLLGTHDKEVKDGDKRHNHQERAEKLRASACCGDKESVGRDGHKRSTVEGD